MQLYSISDEYIQYLIQFFPRIYSNKEEQRTHTRKYLGTVIEVGGVKYYIPLSSPKDKHDYIEIDGIKAIRKDSLIVIRIISGPASAPELKATLQIGTMIPVPDDALELYDINAEPDSKYKDLVNEEMIFIRKNEARIIKAAEKLYKMRYAANPVPIVTHCLDFKAIEIKCREWTDKKPN